MPEVTPFQVLIVDDHPLMRRGIRQLLELDPAIHVVAEAGDGASAIDLANRIEPDLILLDLNMKGLSGLDTLNELRRASLAPRSIILTFPFSSSDTYALMAACSAGYRPEFTETAAVLGAVRKGTTVWTRAHYQVSTE
ncbi:response regulator, partial [Leptospira interrogans serovar Pomona]|nr:response regulator [Leptospira interrogans serovar Pomona]